MTDKPVQLSLGFGGVGGSLPEKLLKDEDTRTLVFRANRIHTLAYHARLDYDRLKGQEEGLEKAIQQSIGSEWAMYRGERWSREAVMSIRRFLKRFESEQCERIVQLRDIVKELNKRGASIEIDGHLADELGC